MTEPRSPLQHLVPGWFAIVMGLCGLSLAWHRAVPLLGEPALGASLAVGLLAVVAALVLSAASVLRWQRHRQAWVQDLRHPVRHAFIAALSASLILLATVAVTTLGASPWAAGVWMAGAAWHFGITLWVLRRWLQVGPGGGVAWPSMTPVMFIPVVGNVLVPLAGVPLGFVEWSTAQFAVGLLFWPILLVLLVVRIANHGLWPERLLPSTFISVAPASVGGLAALQLGVPNALGWAAWGIALFFLLWSGSVVRRMLGQPFAISFWGLSFPLAAFSALTLRLAGNAAPWFISVALLSLAVASLVIAALLLATVRGLRQGSLLVPEPVAPIVPALEKTG